MTLLAELRSLRRPTRIEMPPPPAPGDMAPEVVAPEVVAAEQPGPATVSFGRRVGSPFLIAFLRHVGCPFAEATVRDLSLWHRRLPALEVLVVSHGDREATERWWRRVRGPNLPVVADPLRRIYAAWGVGTTQAGHFLGPRSLAGVVRLWPRGIRNRWASGSRWQSAATFVVGGDGRIRWRHLPKHAGDLPDLAVAYRALDGVPTPQD